LNKRDIRLIVPEDVDEEQLRRVYRIGLDGSAPLQVSSTGSDFYPRCSPAGTRVAFLRGEPQPVHRSTLWVVELENGTHTN
jgi:Tol biopolymer transport system component